MPPALPLPEATPTFIVPAEWRAIDFISDLHLAETTPRAFDAWAAHLRHTRADAVFILGDLFDVWIGDDMAEGGFDARCVDVLRRAAERKTIAFMSGNRDFLVGDAMLESNGLMRLADPTVVAAFGARALVSHGDALCLGDVAYQRYRSVVRRPALQRVFRALPLSARLAIGRAMRRKSSRRRPGSPVRHVDVDDAATAGWVAAANVPTLIHGHTHAPASHALAGSGVRHVLSDWDLDGAVPPRAEVLRWQASGFSRIAPETSPAPAQAAP
ncbi:MAG: UDP-2,3-diacylglucosamine diphosphatase [Caldimonas sp.]